MHPLVTSARARRVVAALLYAGGFAYAVATLWSYPRWTVDDAYIAFRYARHLVQHGQLTWTVGADPVEGYTGVALPLLVAAGMRLGVAAERTARLVGVSAFFVAAWTLRDNQRRLRVPEPVRAYVTATAMLFPPLYAHATSGLETLLFAATLGVCFGALLSCHASPRPGAQARLWLALLALALVRPEGVLFAAAFGGALAARIARAEDARRPLSAALAAALFVLPYGAYFAWRAHYYGRLLPNTYYAKIAPRGFDPGFLETCGALAGALLPVVAAGVALTVLLPRRARVPRGPAVAAAAALAVLAVQYSRSTLVMGYLYRFQVHGLFLALPFAGVLLASAAHTGELPRRYGATRGGVLALTIAACLVAWPVESIAAQRATRAQARRYLDIETEQHARVGAWLRDHLPPSEAIACWVDAGLIPWVAEPRVAIDFGGLNDETLARPGLPRQAVADYFFARSPGALVVTSDSPTRLAPQHDGDMVTSDPRFAAYEPRLALCSPEYPTAPCEVVFVRRGVVLR